MCCHGFSVNSLPGPNFQSRKFKFKINFIDVFQFIPRKELCVISSLQILAFETTKTQHALVLEFPMILFNKVYILQSRHTTKILFYQHIVILWIYFRYYAGIFMNLLKVNIKFHFTLFEI